MSEKTKLAQLAAFVEYCSFPCTKQDLLDLAEDENATDELMEVLQSLPEKEYLSETDIIESV